MNTPKQNSKIALAIFMMLTLIGCAAMEQAYRENVCGYDGSYKAGMNDARQNEPMRAGVANLCEETQKSETEKGYREGYEKGLELSQNKGVQVVIGNNQLTTLQKYECLESFGQKQCGYGCVSSYGKIKCAAAPGMKCLSAYGNIECGYDCKQAYGKVVCASQPGMSCMEGYGDIKCGFNCKKAFGSIECTP